MLMFILFLRFLMHGTLAANISVQYHNIKQMNLYIVIVP